MFDETRQNVHVCIEGVCILEEWVDKLFALGQFLQDTDSNPEIVVDVYAFVSVTIGGIRISEVDFRTANGGSSYMRSADDAQPFIFGCEQFILTHGIEPHKPQGWSTYLNEHGEARIQLLRAMGMEGEADEEYRRQQAQEANLMAAAETAAVAGFQEERQLTPTQADSVREAMDRPPATVEPQHLPPRSPKAC